MKFYNFLLNKTNISENSHLISVGFVREKKNMKYFMYILSMPNISSLGNYEDGHNFMDVNLDLPSYMF